MSPEAELWDPSTSSERLSQIAQQRYDLHAQVLTHPRCYPGLTQWIAQVNPAAAGAVGAVGDGAGEGGAHAGGGAGEGGAHAGVQSKLPSQSPLGSDAEAGSRGARAWDKTWFKVVAGAAAGLLVAGAALGTFALMSGGKKADADSAAVVAQSETSEASEAKSKEEAKTLEPTEAAEEPETVKEEPVATPEPVYVGASIPGAYPGAGGPRPAEATPITTVHELKYGGTLAAIVTPSGNIGCDFGYEGAGCGVASYIQDRPYGDGTGGDPKWWMGFRDDSAPVLDIRGDAPSFIWSDYPVQEVQYGQVVYWEQWVCASAEEGLTCWNTTTGHGAFMNRDGYTGF